MVTATRSGTHDIDTGLNNSSAFLKTCLSNPGTKSSELLDFDDSKGAGRAAT